MGIVEVTNKQKTYLQGISEQWKCRLGYMRKIQYKVNKKGGNRL